MEGNEMNVFAQTHCLDSEKEDSTSDNISRQNKGGFRHFVEESTLRIVSLDEVEELSDSGSQSRIDGNIRRSSSTVSSEPPVRFAIILKWKPKYITSGEGLLRLLFMISTTVSLACVTSAGTNTTDILDMSFESVVRAHMFVTVLALLIALAFFILGVTNLIKSFPSSWNNIDAFLHASLCVLLLFSSAMLLHAEHLIYEGDPPMTEWAKLLLSCAAAFGILSTIVGVFIAATRFIGSKDQVMSEDIVLTTLQSS